MGWVEVYQKIESNVSSLTFSPFRACVKEVEAGIAIVVYVASKYAKPAPLDIVGQQLKAGRLDVPIVLHCKIEYIR